MTRPEPADAQPPATYEPEAASEPEGPGDEATYQAILSAVMETARGRWFLAEYARRNRAADTELVLQALARLEARVTQQNAQAAFPPGPVTEPGQSRPESVSNAWTPDTAPRATPRAGDEAIPEERGEPDSPAPETRPAARDPREAPASRRQLAAVAEPRDTEEAEKGPDVPPAAGRLAQLSHWERQALFS